MYRLYLKTHSCEPSRAKLDLSDTWVITELSLIMRFAGGGGGVGGILRKDGVEGGIKAATWWRDYTGGDNYLLVVGEAVGPTCGAASHYYDAAGRRWTPDGAESYQSHSSQWADRRQASGTLVTRAEMAFGPGSGLWLRVAGGGLGGLAALEGQQQVVNYLFSFTG